MQFIGNRYELLDFDDGIQMGKLCRARDTYENKIVYIKLINKIDKLSSEFKPDLIDELTVLNQINSPYIAKVEHIDIHCTEFDTYYYIVSEYHYGESLKEYIYNNELSVESITNISIKIVKILDKLNSMGLYHGSLNPNNIIIDRNEEIKIYDLGIAKANKGINLRLNNEICYLCPHQLNINFTDKESDFFVLGIILFEMVFRELPFGYAYNEKEMLRSVDKGIRWSLLIYDDRYERIINIAKKLLDRKAKYRDASNILVDLSSIMYDESKKAKEVKTKYEEFEENEEYYEEEYYETDVYSYSVNYKKKLLFSGFMVLLIISIVISSL